MLDYLWGIGLLFLIFWCARAPTISHRWLALTRHPRFALRGFSAYAHWAIIGARQRARDAQRLQQEAKEPQKHKSQ